MIKETRQERVEHIDALMDALIKAARTGTPSEVQDARSDLGVFMMNRLPSPVPPHAAGEEDTTKLRTEFTNTLGEYLNAWTGYKEHPCAECSQRVTIAHDRLWRMVSPAASQATPGTHEEWLTLRSRLAYLEGFRAAVLRTVGMDQENA